MKLPLFPRLLLGGRSRGSQFALLLTIVVGVTNSGCGSGSASALGKGNGGPVAATISGTIAVGTAPSAIAVDPNRNKIYVADFGTMTPLGGPTCSPSGADIRVIDGATQSATSARFGFLSPESLNPFALTVNASSQIFYVVAHQFALSLNLTCGYVRDGVEVFDATTLTQTKNIGYLVGSLGGIDVNPTNGNIYVADPEFNNIAVINSNGNPVALIIMPVGTGPASVAVNANTSKIYVANGGSNSISVIDSAANSVITTITDPKAVAPIAVAVNPATDMIYVANSKSDNLSVIDGATGAIVATITVGTSPSGVAVDSQTNFIYVANAGNSQMGDPGNITVINGATNATTTLTDPKALQPSAITVNPVTNKIYVANSGSNNVTVIDGAP